MVTVHCGDRRFDHVLVGKPEEWQEEVFTDLKDAVRQEFARKTELAICETVGTDNGGELVELFDVEDLVGAFEDVAGKQKRLNLVVQVI